MAASHAGWRAWLGVVELAVCRRLLLAGLGGVYACAFVSLGVQLPGLVGEGGILPNADFFEAVARAEHLGFMDVPSLCWGAGCSDATLTALWLAGLGAALMLVVGVAPLLAAPLCFVSYLSLVHAGQRFLGFQWDQLLLEAGFLALLLVPVRAWGPRSAAWRAQPSPAAWLLVRWLLFRLMLSSGAVKLLSGDGTWLELEALAYHFETQPLPMLSSWWVHQLPEALLSVATLATLVLEVGLPFLYWGPRRLRQLAVVLTLLLMLIISATGSYGFFNLLTAVLCLSLLEDRDLPARLRGWLLPAGGNEPSRGRGLSGRAWVALRGAAVAVLALLSLVPLFGALGWEARLPASLQASYAGTRGFRIVNNYGLFAHMTTERPELLVEASLDGREWRPYEFRWKPGDLAQAPRAAYLHMPRLDWQLWFAALRGRPPGWLAPFCARLLQGRPEVLALLEGNPFPDEPPRFVRVIRYDYRFSNVEERRATGQWWHRGPGRQVLALSADDLR